jgi:hypothetical protein
MTAAAAAAILTAGDPPVLAAAKADIERVLLQLEERHLVERRD